MSLIIDLADALRWVFSALFFVVALLKLFSLRLVREYLIQMGLPVRVSRVGAAGVILVELGIGITILAAPAIIAGSVTCIIFLAFSFLTLLSQRRRAVCPCLGPLESLERRNVVGLRVKSSRNIWQAGVTSA